MSELLVIDKDTLTGIADAVRLVKDSKDTIPVIRLAEEITNLSNVPEDLAEALTGIIDRSLTEIVIPKNVAKIGAGAFYNCTACLSYDFTAFETYEEIPPLENVNAFTGINTNAKIYVRGELYNRWKRKSNWSSYAEYFSAVGEVPPDSASAGLSLDYNDEYTALIITGRGSCTDAVITVPETYDLGGGLMQFESIGEDAFKDDTTATELVFPSYGVMVEDQAFWACKTLKKITNLKKGGYYAFYNCTALESVIFTDGVTFELDSFYGCTACKLYDFSACTSIPYLPLSTCITASSGTKIVVPDALYDSWIAATNWSTFASYIVKASEA